MAHDPIARAVAVHHARLRAEGKGVCPTCHQVAPLRRSALNWDDFPAELRAYFTAIRDELERRAQRHGTDTIEELIAVIMASRSVDQDFGGAWLTPGLWQAVGDQLLGPTEKENA